MNKENRSAAGSRRSAVAERIRIREEWSVLKGTEHKSVPTKRIQQPKRAKETKFSSENKNTSSDVLCGVVALVEVGNESRALALRAALAALGATVVPTWNVLVTHLIWADGGCRSARAKARMLGSRLVSPLWVEACAASNRRLPEQTFPAAARASDLPSPRTLRRLLKIAEMENVPLVDLLLDSSTEKKTKKTNKEQATDTEADTSKETTRDKSTDTSRNTSTDSSGDTSRDTTAKRTVQLQSKLVLQLSVINEETVTKISDLEQTSEPNLYLTPTQCDIESRVNTAPRRAMPISMTPPAAKKSRRKLFHQKEINDETECESDEDVPPKATHSKQLTQAEKRNLARAERMAKRICASCNPAKTTNNNDKRKNPSTPKLRIVPTGMSRSERRVVCRAIRQLGGRIQSQVNWKTTHVLLGSCRAEPPLLPITQWNITGVENINRQENAMLVPSCDIKKARTHKALAGAARGCKVLYGQWALDSLEAKKWLHHYGYEVPHLKKISERAHVERLAFCYMRSDYGYDVFHGIRVRFDPIVEQKAAVTDLLKLCGAVVINPNGELVRDNALTLNGTQIQRGYPQKGPPDLVYDLTIGTSDGAVASKWVFDSIAAGRMRNVRTYINCAYSQQQLSNSRTFA